MAIVLPDQPERDYALMLQRLRLANVPFVVGGAWGVEHYVRLGRVTHDLDLMVESKELLRAGNVLTEAGSRVTDRDALQTRHQFGGADVDLIHHVVQGEYAVDGGWFRHGRFGRLFGVATRFAAPEELIWSKAFVAARHRYDGADVVHLLRQTHRSLDWRRLMARFAPFPRLLLAYVSLFSFCYPDEPGSVPPWLRDALLLDLETPVEPATPIVCRGPLLDRASFEFDVHRKGYADARRASG